MSDNPLDDIPLFDRVSIPAVLVADGEDPSSALSNAGIIDAVAIPVVTGDNSKLSAAALGDGFTPNLTGVLESDQEDDQQAFSSETADATAAQAAADTSKPATASLPAAYGLQPLAPVRQRGF